MGFLSVMLTCISASQRRVAVQCCATNVPHTCQNCSPWPMAATEDAELPKFLGQWPQAKSAFIHLFQCHQIWLFSNFCMIRERLGSLGLYLKPVHRPCILLHLGRHSGWLLLPTTALRNTELSVVAIQSYHVPTVLTDCIWWSWWWRQMRSCVWWWRWSVDLTLLIHCSLIWGRKVEWAAVHFVLFICLSPHPWLALFSQKH